MGKNEEKYCIRCGGYTNHEWQVDYDSDPDEPQFFQICLRCEGVDDKIDKRLEAGQITL